MIHAETHIDIATRLDDIAVLIGTQQNKEIELHTGDVVERPGLDLSTYSTVLEDSAQRWRHGITTMPVIGSISVGKTTFLNGLLGTDLPTGPGAVTGIVLELTAEAFDGFRVFYTDGTEKYTDGTEKTMDAEAYRDFSLVEDGGSIVKGEAFRLPAHLQPVLYARLGRLRGLPEKGLVFVDTLGFNAGGAAAATTRGYLNNADIIIMVLDSRQLFTERDTELVEDIVVGGIEREDVEDASIFFVINHLATDTEEAKELVRKQVKAKLEGLVPAEEIDNRVFLIDALTAFSLTRAGESGAALEATGLPYFQRSLEAAIETGDLLQAKLERAMDHRVLPAINAALEEIDLRREALEMGEAEREQAIAASQRPLVDARAKKQNVLKAVDSLIEKVAARAKTLFLSEFAEKMGDRAFWREKWRKEGFALGWWEMAKAIPPVGDYEERRQALADKIQPILERMFQSELDAWVAALPDKLTDDLDKFEAQPLVDIDQALDEFQALLKRSDFHLKGIGEIDVIQSDANWKRLIIGSISLAMDPFTAAGVVYAPDIRAFIRRILVALAGATVSAVVMIIGAPFSIAAFMIPISIAVAHAYITVGRAALNMSLDKRSGKSSLANRIADEARKQFAAEGANIGAEIERVMAKSFAEPREKLAAVLEGEVTGREARSKTLRDAAGDELVEKTRLEGIASALRSQLAVLSARVYGRVLTDAEIKERLEPVESSNG